MLLSIHKEETDEINWSNVANVFCGANEKSRRTFGIFYVEDFLQLNAWSVDIFKKHNLLMLMDIFSGSKENIYFVNPCLK